MSLRAVAHIQLSALQHNLRQVKSLAPHSRVMAMIKANAYGHGLQRVALALIEADAFGVATLYEALALRDIGVQKPIAVMSGFADIEELTIMAERNITAVVHAAYQLPLLESAALKTPLSVWLKIDSGMHRLGFQPREASDAYARLMACPQVCKPFGAMTHFACSDETDKSRTEQQITTFKQCVTWPCETSMACSAAIINWPQSHADWVRPGIMLYGVSPFVGHIGAEFNLQPVMTLTSRLIAIKHLHKGDAIGYGATWQCPEDMPVGVVAMGYGDGYPRHAKSGTPVYLHDKLCPLVGRVSMDLIAIDLRQQPHANVGDRVLLWGDGLPIEQVALAAGTIGYELLCKVTQRVEFVYV